MSLAEVVLLVWSVTCGGLVFEVQYIFMKLKNFCGTHISHVQHIIFISTECPFHTLGFHRAIFQYHNL